MFKYIVETNVEEYLRRVKSLKTDTLEERLNILIDFVVDFEKHYKNVLLLVIDLFRIYGSDETEKIISEFSKYYIDTMARQLNLPDQLAQPLFIYIVGLVFQSLLIPNQTSFSGNMSGLKSILKSVALKSDELDADSNTILFNTIFEKNSKKIRILTRVLVKIQIRFEFMLQSKLEFFRSDRNILLAITMKERNGYEQNRIDNRRISRYRI